MENMNKYAFFKGSKEQRRSHIYNLSYGLYWLLKFLTFVYMQYMGEVGANFEVYRNDEITVEEIKKLVTVPSYIKFHKFTC